MKSRLFRSLSVFMAVLIISLTFMAPVLEARAVAVVLTPGMAIVIIALLGACGITFISNEQAMWAAQHAWDNMTDNMRNSLTVVYGGGSQLPPDDDDNWWQRFKVKSYDLWQKGFIGGLVLSAYLFLEIKAFFHDLFGVDEETAAAGQTNAVVSGNNLLFHVSPPPDGSYSLFLEVPVPLGLPQSYLNRAHQYPYVIIWRSTTRQYSGFNYEYGVYYRFLAFNNRPDVTFYQNAYSLRGSGNFTAYSLSDGSWSSFQYFNPSMTPMSMTNIEILYSNFDIYYEADSLGVSELFYHQSQNSIHVGGLAISFDAFKHMLPAGVNEVFIALPDTVDYFIGPVLPPGWNDLLLNHDGVDRNTVPPDWDYNQAIAHLQGIIDQLIIDFSHVNPDWQPVRDLELEIANLRQQLAQQGADVVGGTDPLNDVMLDLGYRIRELDDRLRLGQIQIDEMERALEEAAQALRDLQNQPGDNPNPPPIVPPLPLPGEINWFRLSDAWSGLKDVFPFSIPFLIVAIFKEFESAPVRPDAVTLNLLPWFDDSTGRITVDFFSEDFEPLARIVRIFTLVSFVTGLAILTGRVIRW